MKLITFFLFLAVFSFFFEKILYAQNRIELNTDLMCSTFKIQGDNGSFGTAFVLGKPLKADSSNARFVLITANHVLTGMNGDSATLYLRERNDMGIYKKIPFKFKIRNQGNPLWIKHDSADVAAMYVGLPKNINIKLFTLDLLAGDEIFNKIEIHPGDVFMCLGFPLGQESNEYGFPILRNGMLSSYPVVPMKLAKSFLLDVKIFQGNSGGPVYFAQSGRTYNGSLHSETWQFIAGLVSGERINPIHTTSGYKESIENQQLSLAVIVPSIFIKETIEKLPAY